MTTAYPGTAAALPDHADPKVSADIARVLRQHGAEHAIHAVLTIVNRPPVAAADGLAGPNLTGSNALSGREVEVLVRMARGLSNGEIGRELFLAEDTIKCHARRLYRKLRCRDRAHAVNTAWELGLLGRGRR